MKRLLLPLLVLASGLCNGQSSPAFSFSTLPEWPSAASGPVRPESGEVKARYVRMHISAKRSGSENLMQLSEI